VRELYGVAARLRREQGGAALVFGALSPRTRNAQVGLYQAGEVDLLVATDAIGMGLNLDIDHVVFTGLTKFDGVGPGRSPRPRWARSPGRAGRHVRDGHFAATTDLGPFDPRLVDAVETHRFAPLTHLYWRTDDLDFFSPLALLGSLDRPPPHPFLVRMRHAEDQAALAALTRDADVMALARDPGSVRLLWEVCQVPDFQGVVTEGHTRLLSRVFRFLRGPAGRIPEDFLASHVKDIDRPDGDVETLLGRIAAIRTWTYISHRGSWVPDARFWQERTRAVEDRLSDALHERLTQEFVDRPGTVIARHDPSELVTSVGGDGEVLVQGLRAGVLEGFRFRPDREVREGSRGSSPPPTARSRASCASGWRRSSARTTRRSRWDPEPRSCGGARRWPTSRPGRPAAAAGGGRGERPARPPAAGARAATARRLARRAPARVAPSRSSPCATPLPPGSRAGSPSPSSRGSAPWPAAASPGRSRP
jgi:ATP-dependent RNA helicase SUPV3L1/SUV3